MSYMEPDTGEYIWIFYNRKRIHEANGYLTPEEYYRQHQTD